MKKEQLNIIKKIIKGVEEKTGGKVDYVTGHLNNCKDRYSRTDGVSNNLFLFTMIAFILIGILAMFLSL